MINNILIVVSVLCLGIAIGYWLRQAWIAAEQVKKVFAPRVQAPTDKDLQRWREQQHQFDQTDDDHLPMLLKRQAD